VPESPEAVVEGPEATCSSRRLLGYVVCMERQCLRTALLSHPDCIKWRASRPKDSS
jgi:hypothetical protein